MPATITGAGGGWLNQGEYFLDLAKLASRPPSLEEADGFRERLRSGESQVTRLYRCDWSDRIRAAEWLLGYSYSELKPGVDADDLADEIAFNQDVLGEDYDPGDVANLRRVIPAQDPERPWLFCDEVELVQGEGAWVESPFVYVLDADGNPVLDDDGEPLLAPAVHYVGNDRAGYAGSQSEPDDILGLVEPELTPPSGEFSDGKALLRATFRPRDYSVFTDTQMEDKGGNELRRYVRRTEEMALEALPLARLAKSGGVLMFAEEITEVSDIIFDFSILGQPVPEAGVVQYPMKNLTYEWLDVPDLPLGGHARCVGRVNNAPFDGLRGSPSYPAETLLCLPWRFKQRTSVAGRISWDIQYRFVFRPQKWNRFPAGDGNHYLATFGGEVNGPRVYKLADFGDLFRVPPPRKYHD